MCIRDRGIFYCPHRPEKGCQCRKPATGLLAAIESELAQSPRGSFFVGDSVRDLQAARAYGCQPVLVRTGKGRASAAALAARTAVVAGADAIPVYDDLAAAVQEILRAAPIPKDDR